MFAAKVMLQYQQHSPERLRLEGGEEEGGDRRGGSEGRIRL